MKKLIPTIFLDRDGTINIDNGYVYKIDDYKFIDGVIDAMCDLKEMGYALVVITNQSGIARGKFTKAQFKDLTEWMRLSLVNYGIKLDGIFYCPHHPNGCIKEYRKICDCRKPRSGMIKLAQSYLNIDLSQSFMVGDQIEDMQAAIEAGLGTKVLVETGKIITKNIQKTADLVLNSLADLPKKIRNIKTIKQKRAF